MKYFWLGAAVITVTIIGAVCFKSLAGPLNADFTMFWKLRELAYPPPYLLVIKPFSLLPYGAAFILWVTLTGALYLSPGCTNSLQGHGAEVPSSAF